MQEHLHQLTMHLSMDVASAIPQLLHTYVLPSFFNFLRQSLQEKYAKPSHIQHKLWWHAQGRRPPVHIKYIQFYPSILADYKYVDVEDLFNLWASY